ncbi:DUF1467 domain-containing protein [Haloterrigena salifodinae]|uniref:DUF1467 domain-containing protein n=1 Tax=Haloterrigena salifodinae TaxID=2675099 RepID=UPI000F86280F|nr:DUF1467 domain-containing protein [Haloterrigena salifodinae]
MKRSFASRSGSVLVGAVALVAVGVASNIGLDSPYRLFPSLLLMALGVAGVATQVRDYSVAQLRLAAKRWWVVAFVAFLPYALVAAPESDSAAAVADGLAAPPIPLVLESISGAVVCCAVAVTVLYGFASYGVHPGRTSPEERVLADGGDD